MYYILSVRLSCGAQLLCLVVQRNFCLSFQIIAVLRTVPMTS